jgi:hypothetical protein
MGLPVLRYRHLILLHTQMRDGCRRRSTVREWLAEFGPYTPRYQPRSGERRVSTPANQQPKPSPIPRLVEGKEIQARIKKKLAVPKYSSISTIRDFSPIPRRFNLHLSKERKRATHTHLTQISDEYARMELEEIRLSKGCISLQHQQGLQGTG